VRTVWGPGDQHGLAERGEAADILAVGPGLPALRLHPAQRLHPQPDVIGGHIDQPADDTRRQQRVLPRGGDEALHRRRKALTACVLVKQVA
jgi:hypothetical protein